MYYMRMMNQGLRCYKTILIVVFLLQRIFLFGQPSIVGIDTTEVVKIGGISQVLKMKSKDVGKPILLYLHGASYKSYSVISDIDRLTSRLQEHFLVVLWDQREYGKTYELNSSPVPLTIKLIVGDTKEVIDYLLQKFQRKKLFLAGHSMGSVEGIHIATENPEKLFAFIAMSPAVYGIKSQKMGLEMLREHFALVNNRRATNELAQIKLPARDFESLFIKYVWQSEYDGEHMSDSVREAIKPSLKMWMETSSAALSNEIFEMNFFKQFPTVKCPIYFFSGRKDFSTNSEISFDYFKKVKAPKKGFFWFEKSAHGLPDKEPVLMQNLIIQIAGKN